MFVCTFYSFKGGVGRSLALMNVAAALVKADRKVLVVDFDLEAPGLTTFAPCTVAHGKPGLVEYISEYRITRAANSVTDYIYECDLREGVGTADERSLSGLSIMPAGNVEDPAYALNFSSLDWRALYENESGFLLFEEIKAQWEDLGFDYVLIDSRTGHTDISGICTRQLPDAVAMVFFPNEQNLSGLKQIVDDVRKEPSAQTPIDLLFVASRVPRLDDEYNILGQWMERFRDQLGYRQDEFLVVHHYDSLALLDQRIFTLDRPKTSLARELNDLTQSIKSLNFEDSEGAIRYLLKVTQSASRIPASVRMPTEDSVEDADGRVDKIRESHSFDYVVMFFVSMYYYGKSLLSDAAKAAEAATASLGSTRTTGYDRDKINSSLNVLQMRIYREQGNDSLSADAAVRLLSMPDLTPSSLRDALITLASTHPDRLPDPQNIKSFTSMAPKELFASFLALNFSIETTRYSARALKWVIDKYDYGAVDPDEIIDISLSLISGGEMEAARSLLKANTPQSDFEEAAFAFNLAIANWGIEGQPSEELFAIALETGERLEVDNDRFEPNFYQCLALTAGVCGKQSTALSYCDRAIFGMRQVSGEMFSCWSFMNRIESRFIEETEALKAYIMSSGGIPDVIARSA